MSMVIFLHGLNTYGDDELHVGPFFTLGSMHRHLERAFQERDIEFIGVRGLGAGSPEEQAERALAFLREAGMVDEPDLPPVHFLGQSVGGLVARVLAARTEFEGRARSIMTIGTPHAGTPVARFGIELETRYPRMHQWAARFGYDTRQRSGIFRHFTPEALQEFNARYPERTEVREICLLCSVEKKDLSLPLRPFYTKLHPRLADGTCAPGDGMILCDSQTRGEVYGPFALDHFAQLGFFLQLSPASRRKARNEFNRLVETVAGLVSN